MRATRRGYEAASFGVALALVALLGASRAAAAAASLVAGAFALAFLALRAPRVEASRELARPRAVEGEAVELRARLRLASPRRLRVALDWGAPDALAPLDEAETIVELRRGQAVEVASRWQATRWGRARFGPLRVVVRDPLGLLEHAQEIGEPMPLRVEPRPDSVGKYRARASQPQPALGAYHVARPGDGFEFFALREYRPGDSIRRINWKASARSGETIVNQVTLESFARIVVFLDLREKEGLGASPPYVATGRAAAALLLHHDRARDHLSLVVLQSTARRLTLAPNPRANELLGELAAESCEGDVAFVDAVREHASLLRPRSPAYFLTSGALDDTLSEAVSYARAMGAVPYVLVPPRTDGLPPPEGDEIARSREVALAAVRATGAHVAEWDDLEAALFAA